MSLETRQLICLACRHVWEGLWDIDHSIPSICPACQGKHARPIRQTGYPTIQLPFCAETENLFDVKIAEGDEVHFSIPGMHDGRTFRLAGVLPRETALNFAAHLAHAADANGLEFLRLYNAIKGLKITYG